MEKRRKVVKESMLCKNCGAHLYPGVAHLCSVQSGNANGGDALRGFLLRLLVPLIVLIVTELIGGIWWAATIQSGQAAQHNELQDLKREVEQLDGYFRKPLPQSFIMPPSQGLQLFPIMYEAAASPAEAQASQRRRVIPLDVIHRFNLHPSMRAFGAFLLGEDGLGYDFDDVVAVIFEMTKEHWQLPRGKQ